MFPLGPEEYDRVTCRSTVCATALDEPLTVLGRRDGKPLAVAAIGLDGRNEIGRGRPQILHRLVGQDDAHAHAASQLKHVFDVAGNHALELVDDQVDLMAAFDLGCRRQQRIGDQPSDFRR